jgi:hypothetical protein
MKAKKVKRLAKKPKLTNADKAALRRIMVKVRGIKIWNSQH